MATRASRVIKTRYEPREFFKDYHIRHQRWAVMVCHRRAGKTVAVLGDMCEKALYNQRERPRYAYIAPLYNQAKQIAWEYLKAMTEETQVKVSESGLYVELVGGARVTLYGADNPDAFRGLYFDGAALDEYGNMRPSIWSQVLLPALADRRGWATFIGTPNGPNHFRDLWLKATELEKEKYFTKMLKVTDTSVLSQEDVNELRALMSEEEFEQEMMCNFEASTRGAFYAKEIVRAEEEGRISNFELDDSPLHFVLDLGYRDDTACWVWQERPDGYALVKAFSNNNRPIAYYIALIAEICGELGAPRGKVYLPHDARAKSLQTGRSIVEQFLAAGIRPEIVPNLDLMDGVSAARMVFGDCYFHKDLCRDGVLALKSYHREYDEDRKVHRDTPVHDWSSHYADAFRYFALVANKSRRPTIIQPVTSLGNKPITGTFTLDDLWATRPSTASAFRKF